MRPIDADALLEELNQLNTYTYTKDINGGKLTFQVCGLGDVGRLITKMPTFERPRGEWISVEDRLPEEDGTYITMTNATGKSRGVIPMEYRTSSIRGKIVRRWMWHDRISPWGVTHWMPLPEPPGGEDDG